MGHLVLEKDGAQGDAGVKLAVEAEITHGSGIGGAGRRLHGADDLHRANLRRTAHRACREGGPEHIQRGMIPGEAARDIGDDVHDVAVTLDRHEVGQFDAAEFGNPSHIIAGEINEHQVLGTLLGIIEQFQPESLISLGGRTPLAGPGDWTDLNFSVGHLHMHLGGTSDQGDAAGQSQTEHVGRGIDEA